MRCSKLVILVNRAKTIANLFATTSLFFILAVMLELFIGANSDIPAMLLVVLGSLWVLLFVVYLLLVFKH
jgi:hypothetical protein